MIKTPDRVDQDEPADAARLLETQAMLAAIGRIQGQLLTRKDSRAAFDALLEELLRASQSTYGFIAEAICGADSASTLKVHAITDSAWNDQSREARAEGGGPGLEFRRVDVLVDAVMRAPDQLVMSNSPAKDVPGEPPPGHPALDSFLGIQFVHGDQMLGVVGLGNREGGYSEAVHETLQPLLDTVRTVLIAYRSERARSQAEAAALRLNQELSSSVQALERAGSDSRALSRMRDELQACHSLADIARVAERFSISVLGAACGALCLYEDGSLTVVHEWGETLPCCTAPEGGASLEHGCATLQLVAHDESLGVLRLALADPDAPRGSAEDERRKTLAEAVSMPLSFALANMRMRDRLRDQAMRDPLSGLFNRRYMEEVIDRECRRASRRDLGMVVFMVDIDHFKRINDTFGHQAGDQVIRDVAHCLEGAIRREDYAFRYGGEEFVLLLSDTAASSMGARGEAILRAVRMLRPVWKDRPVGRVTVSIGAAAFPEHGRSPGALLRAADAAMYLAKQAGRDCAVEALAE